MSQGPAACALTLTSLLQMLPLKLGDNLELRTDSFHTGQLRRLILCIELAGQGIPLKSGFILPPPLDEVTL